MKKGLFGFMTVITVVAVLATTALAYYVSGVVEMNLMDNSLENRLNTVKNAITNSQEETEAIIERISAESIQKAKQFAYMINLTPNILKKTEKIEETRVSLDVSDIYVVNSEGVIVAGTRGDVDGNIADEEFAKDFLPGLNDKSYSHSVMKEKNGKMTFYACSARYDSTGLVIISYQSDNNDKIIELTDVRDIASEQFFSNGILEVINKESWTYASHQDSEKIGKPSEHSKDKFLVTKEGKFGNFDEKIDGKNVFVKYLNFEEYVIVVTVPYKEIYHTRNAVVLALLILVPIVCVAIYLSLRMRYIRKGTWKV